MYRGKSPVNPVADQPGEGSLVASRRNGGRPDLRVDGLHGILAPRVLGFRAVPVMMIDPDGEHEPMQVLHIGGSKMYVLYDPCEEEVLLESVGSVRLKLIESVDCRSP